jgi:hypothetical protein
MGSVSMWEGIFMLVLLKIPMLYLAAVVWWAIRAEPLPGDGGETVRAYAPLTPCDWTGPRRTYRRRKPVRPFRPSDPRARRASAARVRMHA